MTNQEFDGEVDSLIQVLLQSTKDFFARRRRTFDTDSFLEQTSADLDQLSRECFFYGAEVFPNLLQVVPAESKVA